MSRYPWGLALAKPTPYNGGSSRTHTPRPLEVEIPQGYGAFCCLSIEHLLGGCTLGVRRRQRPEAPTAAPS